MYWFFFSHCSDASQLEQWGGKRFESFSVIASWQWDTAYIHNCSDDFMRGHSEIVKHSSDGLRDLWNKLDSRSYAPNRETIRSFAVNPVIWILNSNSRLQIAHLCTPCLVWIPQYAIVPFKMAGSWLRCWWPLACASDRSHLISRKDCIPAKVRLISNDVLCGFMESSHEYWVGYCNKLSPRQRRLLQATRKCPCILQT